METPASFVAAHVARVEPLLREEALAEWNAAATGRPEYDEQAAKLRAQIMRIYADPARFQQLRAWQQSERFDDAQLARQVTLLYHSFAKGQQDEATIDAVTQLQKEVESTYNTFRATFQGAPRSDNELTAVLLNETSSDRLKAAWEAAKEIGPRVADRVLQLARLRNTA